VRLAKLVCVGQDEIQAAPAKNKEDKMFEAFFAQVALAVASK
jgi:hypothetical protein